MAPMTTDEALHLLGRRDCGFCGQRWSLHTSSMKEACRAKGPHVDTNKGEWRCGCPTGPYDTSINPRFVKECTTCGQQRPPPSSK